MELVVESMVQPVMVQPLAQSHRKVVVDNHDNICVIKGSSLVKNLDGGVLVKSNSLVSMPYMEEFTPIVNNLQGLQQLDSTHSSLATVSNPSTSKEACLVEELKIASKWANMLNEKEDSIHKRMTSRFKLQGNLIWVAQRKLILNCPKQKLLKIRGLCVRRLVNDKFF